MKAAACWLDLDELDEDELPNVRFISARDYVAERRLEVAGVDLFVESERLLMDLGLIDSLSFGDDSDSMGVGAFYEPERQRITMVGRFQDQAFEYTVMVHEMVHALQDREHDLSAWLETARGASTDEVVGLRTVVEGPAQFAQERTGIELAELEYEALNWRLFFEDGRTRLATQPASERAPLRALRGVPYVYGLEEEVLSDLAERKPRWGFDRAPRSSVEVVNGKASEGLALRLGAAYRTIWEDTLGGWVVAVGFRGSFTERAVADWRTDRLWFVDAPNGPVMVWRIDLETQEAALDIARTFELRGVRRRLRERSVVAVVGPSEGDDAGLLLEAALSATLDLVEPKSASLVHRTAIASPGCVR